MDFRQIEAFVNVAKYKSFSKAAEAIYLSQPTISAHIATLEEELSLSLFDRNGKEVRLTCAGQILLEYAINLVNIRTNAIAELTSYDDKITGKLTIASSTTPCRFLLPLYVKSFYDIYPSVNFDIKESSTRSVIDMIIEGTADIGFVGENISDSRLKYYNVTDDNLIIISNDSSIPPNISFDDILKYKFILRAKGSATRNVFEKAMLNKGYPLSKLDVFCEVSSLETVLQFVKSGAGISIVSEMACSDYIAAGIVKKHNISDLNISREIYLVSHTKYTMSPSAKAFLNHILKGIKVEP